MKIRRTINNISGRYHAQLEIAELSAVEEEKINVFGDPVINVGGFFSDSIVRPGHTDTVINVIGGGGTGAVLRPVLDVHGSITGVTIVTAGQDFSTTPVLQVVGDGSGASILAILSTGQITDTEIIARGLGYNKTPVTVSFTLAERHRRLRTEFPVKQVFDLADDIDADAKASLWANVVEARCVAAMVALKQRTNPLEGETLTTY